MDRISDLPDQLLTHILTLLPIEEAVRTCILSKRWLNVWTSLPILVFHDHKDLGDDLTDEDFLKRDIEFMEFVCGVLLNRENLPLDTFQLTWSSRFTDIFSNISEILSYAATRLLPRVLYVYTYTSELFILPDSIFTCASVEEMSLTAIFDDEYEYFIEVESISLPCLKKLELHYMKINNHFIRMLLSGCPVLEEIFFDTCCFEIDEISSTVLKKLTMLYCQPFSKIQISCPCVVSLNIGIADSRGITLKNMPSLVTADLSFLSNYDTGDHDVTLLSGLSNVESLRINTNCIMDLLATDILNCPDLNNLKSLDLGDLNMNSHWNLVFSLLQHSPNLDTLILQFFQDLLAADTMNCPNLNTLKSLELRGWDMNFYWNLVVCFLQHSRNLETITLYFSKGSEDATEEELVENVSFQLEYLKTLKITAYKTNEKFAEDVVRNLSVFVKSIGEVIVNPG